MSEQPQAPLIVIAGRPNVGKSTLFNRLTGTRRSIVTDEPGITRDRIYGTVNWNGRTAEIVDTGGIVPDEKAAIPREILRQARVAFDKAGLLILVADAREGVTPLDEELARLLRQTGKPLFIAANKVDTPQQEAQAAAFYGLGKAVFPVSAEHGAGTDDLLDAAFAALGAAPPAAAPAEAAAEAPSQSALQPVEVAIIGRPNVGKSTLLNRLAGEERAIVSPEPGTTRDSVDTDVVHDGKPYRFVDTAGIRRKGKTKLVAEKLAVVMARKSLERADVALLIIDASLGVTSTDATIAEYAEQSGRSVNLVMNKWDLAVAAAREAAEDAVHHAALQAAPKIPRKAPAQRHPRSPARKGKARDTRAPAFDAAQLLKDYEVLVRDKLKFLSYAPVIFLSAKTGERTGKLYELIDRVAAARRRRISTGELNRWLAEVDLDRGTSPAGRRIKIFYVTQASASPPTFILFTNQTQRLHFSYERFLENQLRARFDFTGAPIRFMQRLKERRGRSRPSSRRRRN
ncbi:MAG TPA: ribosome biogenesis GTPase Der [Candidatus Acidoferrales bacterium]|nr:ribosome biogenesis GTPase Der [Candidatus Acidoferrales bacterium]